MNDYVFEVMKQFPGSFINYNNELILIPKTNLYVGLYNVNTPTDLKFKLLEWCSRDCTFEATGNYGDPLMVNVKELEAINK